MNILIKFLSFIGLTLLSTQIIALPIDWSGGFTADTTLIKSYRRTVLEGTVPANSGSQEIEVAQGDSKNASFQTYIFKLSPTIIINDAATLKGEITTNYGRTEKLGDSRSTSELAGTDNLLYAYNSISGQSLNFSKLYLEYYSDTASYKIGRQGFDWGLGAIYNSGKNSFDRHSFARDGIVAQFKIGNFNIFPFWSKISQGETLTKTSTVTEYGINALYRNHESEITFGISYNSKKGSSNSQLTSDANTDSDKSLGTTDIKITDFYFSKTWKDFSLSLEIPLISGDLGNVFNSSTKTKYKSRAIIFESLYEKSHKWSFGFNFGSIGGTTGSTEKFEALYLNPNYHIANLLFRYNLNAVSDNQQFIFDSYITNAQFIKLAANYTSNKWNSSYSVIWAKADKVAKNGSTTFNHAKNKMFTASGEQKSDLGIEFDANIAYKWNKEISVNASFGYLLTGDYFAFTNDPNREIKTENSYLAQLNTSIEF